MTTVLEIPEQGFMGIQALIDLGPKGIAALAKKVVGEKPTLEMSLLVQQWAKDLQVKPTTLRRAVLSALLPLNQMRVSSGMATEPFLESVTESLEIQPPPKPWRPENLEGWKDIVRLLPPFFQPDGLFSVMSRGFELLSNRQAALADVRIVTELRPLFNEDATKTRALLLTNTLVLEYVRDKETHSLHLALDLNDLQMIVKELESAKKKNGLARKEAKAWKVDILTYGEAAE